MVQENISNLQHPASKPYMLHFDYIHSTKTNAYTHFYNNNNDQSIALYILIINNHVQYRRIKNDNINDKLNPVHNDEQNAAIFTRCVMVLIKVIWWPPI